MQLAQLINQLVGLKTFSASALCGTFIAFGQHWPAAVVGSVYIAANAWESVAKGQE